MSARRFASMVMGALALSVGLLGGCGDAVVGGACADGYVECDGACVPAAACGAGATTDATIETDGATNDADAAIDTAGDPDALVDAGDDGWPLDAGDSDTLADATGDDATRDVAVDGSDASGSDAGDATGDGSSGDASDGATTDGCPPPPYTTSTNCGGCGVACTGSTPVCKPSVADPSTYECRPICDAPAVLCSGKCVDLDVDPLNCGKCSKWCPSGLCNGGKCRGAKPGHVVVIGHDYVGASPTLAVGKVVENAVFLPSRNPVRVLSLDAWADPAAVASVKAILDAGAAASGRSYTRTATTTSADFKDQLVVDKFEVALVFDQSKAPSGALAIAGGDLAATFLSFAQSGGTIVVLDGGAGVHEMPAFLTAGNLLATTAETNVTGKPVDVVAPTDGVGIGVLSPYLAPNRSVAFTSTEPPSASLVTVVQESTSAKPVVLHKVVIKP